MLRCTKAARHPCAYPGRATAGQVRRLRSATPLAAARSTWRTTSPETTTGGNALKFYASVRLDIRRIGSIKKGEEVIGNETKVKVVKNKVSPPFKTAEFDILYGEGISREGEIIDMGVEAKILEKSGSWYAYNGEKIGQGKDNAREFLRENLTLAVEIENKVRDAMGIPLLPTQADDAGPKLVRGKVAAGGKE